MDATSPLLPLVLATGILLGLVGLVLFVLVKLRGASRAAGRARGDRMTEEAFAAATIKAALAPQGGAAAPAPAARPAATPTGIAALAGASGDALDGAVLEALPFGLIVTDEVGIVRRMTTTARQWLGVAGAGTGHPFRNTLAAWPAVADAFAQAHAGEAPPPVVVELAGDGGQPRPTTVTLSRWAPRSGRGGAVAVLAPMTSPVSPDADAEPGTIDAVGRLAGGLAHELANSLTTVHGYAHLIDRNSLSGADRSAIDLIQSSSEKMLTTVEAFRALVRPLPLSPTVFAPADAVQAAIALARQEAGQPNVPVQVTIAPCGTVAGDRVLLEEAIAAVVRNALEASAQTTPSPAVDIRIGQALGAGRAEIVVSDHGPGVPADLRAKVFQPFLSDKPGHDGLGLARAAHVLRAHPGASIALDHPTAGGLAVTIRLPLSA